VFNKHGAERLADWKQFRESLESSQDPYKEVAEFWSSAPFVSPFLDPNNPSKWPDPWHLVLDSRLDDLAICLGMLYTLKLTQRFMDAKCEIHTSMLPKEKQPRYFLVVDRQHVLNFEYRQVVDYQAISNIETKLLWLKTDSL
jgi:hypothetical protein